jgi:Fur family iron response transcriptional regulator
MNSPVEEQVVTKQEIIAKLQASGITPTQQRVIIGRLLFARPQHLSAEQVLGLVNAAGEAKVSKATVYNTLNLFARRGLVREVIVDPTKVFYDSNTSAHHHLFNIDTGLLADVLPGQLCVTGTPELPQDMVVMGIDVVVRVRSNPVPAA